MREVSVARSFGSGTAQGAFLIFPCLPRRNSRRFPHNASNPRPGNCLLDRHYQRRYVNWSFAAARRLFMKSVTLAVGAALLAAGAVLAGPPDDIGTIPIDARGFSAGLALQQMYNKSLEKEAAAKAAAARPKSRAVQAKAQTEDAPAKSKTAVTVASSAPGGTPPGVLRTAAGDTGPKQAKSTPAAASEHYVSDKLRSLFSFKSASPRPQPVRDLPYLGK
jgi:hypothetical protein